MIYIYDKQSLSSKDNKLCLSIKHSIIYDTMLDTVVSKILLYLE